MLNAYDDKTIFLLRDINYHTRIQTILKLFEKVSKSKIHISRAGAYKIELNQERWLGRNFPLKYLEFTLQHKTSCGTKIFYYMGKTFLIKLY